MKPEDKGILGRIGVVTLPHAHHLEPEFPVKVECGRVGGADLERDEATSSQPDHLNDLPQHRLANPQAPKIGVDGNVIDLGIFANLPEDDVADNFIESRVHDDQREGYRPMIDLAAKRALMPWIGKRSPLDLQDRSQIGNFHPSQKIELLGNLVVPYRLSSAWDLRK